MNNSNLSPMVTRYFELMASPDKTRTVEVFSTDATVIDDGHTYRGHDAILGWLSGPASEFTTTSTRLSAEQTGTRALVVVRLEGDFPGGRVDLSYTFDHDPDGLIDSLTITT
ncbi:MAG: nuclear transport factor 2 family protein [Cellulomonas sp.]|nr:nuclear transport factor 2 family protein [Cellulomonas sp.]